MTCVQCGAEIDAENRFCDHCGAEQPAAQARVPVVPQPPAKPNGDPSQGSVALAPPQPSPAAVIANGSGPQNAHYLGSRMQYENTVDIKFGDPELVAAQARGEMRGMMVLAFATFFVWGGIGFLILNLLGLRPLGYLWLLVTAVAAVIIVIGPLLRRRNTPLNEWKLLVDGKGSAADDVYEHIAAELVARESPVEYRAVTLPGVWWRGYLQVRMGKYNAYITCFPFGRDLYLGWSLWWSTSWIELIRAQRKARTSFFVALITLPYTLVQITLQGRDSAVEMAFVHQFDEIKALRECVHSVTLSGAEAAMGAIQAHGKGTIGSAVPEGAAPAFAGRGRPA